MKSGVIILLLTVNLVLAYFLPVGDHDFGWHYRLGEEFLTRGVFPLTNNYSYFLPQYRWAYPSFGYDLGLAWVFDRLGFWGVSLLGAAVFTGIFLIYFSLLKGPAGVRVIIIALVSILSWSIFALGYRSQILGLLFFIVELWVLEFTVKKPRIAWLLPPLFFLWANSHPSFFLGPLVLAVYGIKSYKKSWPVFILSVAATFFNPFGVRIYGEVLDHFRVPLNTMIAEWVAPVGWQSVLIFMTMAVSGVLAFKNKVMLDARFWLTILFGLFALTARRNLPLYYPVLFLFLSRQIKIDWKMPGYLTVCVLGAGIIFFGNRLATFADSGRFSETGYCRELSLPCKAAEKLTNITGNVFNTYEWGGYLDWKLPKAKIFVDGRMPAWQDANGESPYAVFLRILQTREGWDRELAKYETEYLLIGRGTFLDLLLKEKAGNFGYQEQYRDNVAVIYKKR